MASLPEWVDEFEDAPNRDKALQELVNSAPREILDACYELEKVLNDRTQKERHIALIMILADSFMSGTTDRTHGYLARLAKSLSARYKDRP